MIWGMSWFRWFRFIFYHQPSNNTVFLCMFVPFCHSFHVSPSQKGSRWIPKLPNVLSRDSKLPGPMECWESETKKAAVTSWPWLCLLYGMKSYPMIWGFKDMPNYKESYYQPISKICWRSWLRHVRTFFWCWWWIHLINRCTPADMVYI